MTLSLEKLRRAAKRLKSDYSAGDDAARRRVLAVLPERAVLRHADTLHVVAREAGYDSWPKLKFAAEAAAMDRAAKQRRLETALTYGQNWVVEALLDETPDLSAGDFGLQLALLDRAAVSARVSADPALATRLAGRRRPILHLAFSRWIHARPELESDMLAIAEMLVAAGADVNDGMPESADSAHQLSALYGALGHADNVALARWLLAHGADPNDDESLYHATELGHHHGLRLLIEYGADPKGTNALLRAIDFDDAEAVGLLLDARADPDEGVASHPSKEPPTVIPAMHQAARRMAGAEIVERLLAAGGNPTIRYDSVTAYALARVYGNAPVAAALADAGAPTELDASEAMLAAAADGLAQPGRWLDPEALPGLYRSVLRDMVHLPGKLEHMRRLVELGLEYDRPDEMGVTPVQTAGWEGLPDVMAYFLSLGPDLSHVNDYGGALLGTIIHGSENCPQREMPGRDHIACARLALEHGVALPQSEIDYAGDAEMAGFLADWAERHPGAVVAS